MGLAQSTVLELLDYSGIELPFLIDCDQCSTENCREFFHHHDKTQRTVGGLEGLHLHPYQW